MNEIDPTQFRLFSDRLEIQSLLTRYCTAIDGKNFDDLDEVFIGEAFIDYTSAGGVKGEYPEVKEWLGKALALFPMTQHVVSNFEIEVSGNEARSRCVFYNPMGLPGGTNQPDELKLFFIGGYYNDKLVRTEKGWRIAERIEETSWKDLPPQEEA